MTCLLIATALASCLPWPCQDKQDQDPLRTSLEINGGAGSTLDRMVTLKFVKTVPDAPVVEMSLSSDGKTWGPWSPFTAVTQFELPEGPGEKMVYARFSDSEGNVSSPASARILLEAGPSDGQEEAAPPLQPEPFYARARTGVWLGGPKINTRTIDGSRDLTSSAMATVNVAVGMSFCDYFEVEVFGEGAFGKDARVTSAGLAAGWKLYEGPLLLGDGILEIRAAVFVSDLNVDISGFGDFDLGIGYQAGLGGSWKLSEGLWFDAEAAFRGATYSWAGATVLSGDDRAQSLGAELTIGLSYRF